MTTQTTTERKPTGGKAYGSIGHLLTSRLGPGDHHVAEGQHRICTEKKRDRHDVIVVQEKLDGACVAVAMRSGQLVPIGRKGYPTDTAPQEQIREFGKWAMQDGRWQRFARLLQEGERVVGEWLFMIAATPYAIDAPDNMFVAFDIMRGTERIPSEDVYARCDAQRIARVRDLSRGESIAPEAVMATHPHAWAHGPARTNKPEGLVYRVERGGRVDFLAKWVRADHRPGEFFGDVTHRNWVGP